MTDQLSLIPTAQPGPAIGDGGIVNWGDVDLMATTAIRLHNAGDRAAARMAALLPGVMERILELVDSGAYEMEGL